MLIRTILILLFPFILLAQEPIENEEKPFIGLNSELTYHLMEPNQNLRKIEILIDSKSEDLIPEKALIFGFSIIGIADYQSSNIDSKFAYLMRHPTSANAIGTKASEVVVHSSQLSFTGSINSWITAYAELLYSPEQSFGSGTITSLPRNQIEFRKGLILIGNLKKFPLYLSLGKQDIAFGQMGSVSPFTNSTMWHAFSPLAYGAALGFKKYGLNATITAIQGGSQFRAANAPVDGTAVPSRINNFSADINYKLAFSENMSFKAGLSYIEGTTYCQPWPIAHFMPCEENNPATTIYGEFTLKNKILLKGSFAKTQKVWPGTFNPNSPLDVFPASNVSSLDYGARYQINQNDKIIYSISGEFSNFIAGPKNSPWERQSQIILGLNAQVEKTTRIFIEHFRTSGYSPLNFISGGNFDDLGTTHSNRDAQSKGFVGGILVSI